MDKAVLKKFAIESRQDLMQRMENKIKAFYIDEEFSKQQSGDVYILANSKHSLNLSKEEYTKRELLIKRINELGLDQVIEEAAYTWFNRIVAIRYMEIHDYLPLTRDNQSLGIRVLSSKDNTPDPEIMKFTNLVNPDLDIDFEKEKYVELKDNNEKFKYILLLVCRKLGRVIPQVFDGVTDYIDILVPDNLLNESGFINKIVTEVPVENYEQVEIIGWLYQYYNQTEKDRVISAKKAYKKNEIPYATQLFTPDWIVKYMVENSLGRYWIEHGGNMDLVKNWKYFINENLNFEEKPLTVAEVNKMTVKDFNAVLVKKLAKFDPKDIKCIDPCCGSGHILVYMFEVLFQIYESYGYSKKDIAELILENNLYGLDIDDRAGQLSVLSVLLKAREYDKFIFDKNSVENLNITSIQESNYISSFDIDYFDNEKKEKINILIEEFKNGKEKGSLISAISQDYCDIVQYLEKENNIFSYELKNKLLPIINQSKILSNKYDIVVTNPPYMNSNVMPKNLKEYIAKNYSNVKSDLFSAFIVRILKMIKENGKAAFMTPYVWMFISSYEELRKYILDNMNIDSLIQFEYSALEDATVPICSFVLAKNKKLYGKYFRLSDYTGGMNVQEKVYKKLNEERKYFIVSKEKFELIPGKVIGYWISNEFSKVFKNKTISEYLNVKQGTSTGDNELFLRLWYEVQKQKIEFNHVLNSPCELKWYPATKGGEYRKWYGNNEYVVNWYLNGKDIKNCKGSAIRNPQVNFKEGLTWTGISSKALGIRYCPKGFVYLISGKGITGDEKLLKYTLAFCCSKVAYEILKITSPTLSFEVGYIASLPLKIEDKLLDRINELTTSNIEIAKEDWDSFETSWDFMEHPLIEYKECGDYDEKLYKSNYKIEDAYESWKSNCDEKFKLLKNNEEELNRIFIDIYGLNKEIIPKVDDKDITIRKADMLREVKSLISYAVGCMFGRYSLDENGLIYAGGKFDENRYKKFKADSDNIIPITDEAYFDDDIVQRFKQFIEVSFGKETLNENLDFIAETLGKKGTETSAETIRRYFVNDFFDDHCKMYQKRPIYWLLDSGKKNGFKALIYMHRYDESLIPKVRINYLHRVQTTYENLLSDINYKLTTDLSMVDKKNTLKRQADLNAKLQEIKEYDEKIAHIANQRISIDLDDGVKVNYEKFKDILGRIK